MVPFLDWLIVQDTATQLGLLESAEYFKPTDYNPVFRGELEKLAQSHHDPEVREQIETMKGFDWGHYISRSLVRAGFRADEVQEQFHNIVVKLLLSPGRLFKSWNPEQHGPLERRFRASVWNAIRNIAEKNSNYQKWMTVADPTVMAQRFSGRLPHSDVLDNFRRSVSEKLGKLGLAILDQRLAGKETKALVGQAELNHPSVYTIKMTVQAVKTLAQQFAARLDDPAFSKMVSAAMDREAKTVAKRKQAVAATSSHYHPDFQRGSVTLRK